MFHLSALSNSIAWYTVWKLQNFSVTQILHENKVEKCKYFNTFRSSAELFFLFFMNFCIFWRLKPTILIKFIAPKIAKYGSFKTIQNWFHVTEKSRYSHTVWFKPKYFVKVSVLHWEKNFYVENFCIIDKLILQ